MLTSSFQLAPGVGPRREQLLWQAGVVHWADYAGSAATLSAEADRVLRAALDIARDAFDARDADRLAEALPAGEHWRLFSAFGTDAAYLDIETSDDDVATCSISAIGICDRKGPQLLLAGPDLQRFPELARGWSLLVTFNGLSFDLPILRRAFPGWRPPRGHVDLRHLLQRLGQRGGLKAIERRLPALHLPRPPHLEALDAASTGYLFLRGRAGDKDALRRFAEYNLYDVINLRTLMAYAYNGLLESHALRAPGLRAHSAPLAVPERGDVLYDVSKILLAL